tara:strand:- start:262 stop:450 length:189 start_codon:yes stop_codon:yes gene_type:complete
MIFRTGSVLIVGKCTEKILYTVYDFIKSCFEKEFDKIYLEMNNNNKEKKKKKKKKKVILIKS